jgi:hypothetical protein
MDVQKKTALRPDPMRAQRHRPAQVRAHECFFTDASRIDAARAPSPRRKGANGMRICRAIISSAKNEVLTSMDQMDV